MKDYWFFLSYARVDSKKNPRLKQFYDDLAREVIEAVGTTSNVEESDIGFFDEEGIEPGAEWDESLAEALQTSRTLICLYSRGFFISPNCGKEFQAFRMRVQEYSKTLAEGTERPRLIIPILWAAPNRLPQDLPFVVSKLQYTHADFGKTYANVGLHNIMKLHKKPEYENEYRQFLINLADKIVEAARLHNLPPATHRPRLSKVENAFEERPVAQLAGTAASKRLELDIGSTNLGVDTAWFAYVVGRNNDYEKVKERTTTVYYGDEGGKDWRPYLPTEDMKMGVVTQGVTYPEKLINETLWIDENTVNNIRRLEEKNTIVVIIIDPWSVHIETYKRFMEEYDKTRLINCGVLVVWNESDETGEKKAELQTKMEEVFSRSLDSSDVFFRDAISSGQELNAELKAAISEIRTRILKRAKRLRLVNDKSADSMPKISGPVGGSALQ